MINDILKNCQLKFTFVFLKNRRSLKLFVGNYGVLTEDGCFLVDSYYSACEI